MVDAIRLLADPPPYTRLRAYRGTKSYIDRIYLTDLAHKLFACKNLVKHDFSSPLVGTDHDPICVSVGTWALPPPVGPRCSLWNKRDLQTFKAQIEQRATPPPKSLTIWPKPAHGTPASLLT